ncbi:MAG TPA: PBP1A family penicillin-binding protein [Blastocatellia bacterium]|nr:PBP1A family penicillin-binding protein [Blastocatellia bacterium]
MVTVTRKPKTTVVRREEERPGLLRRLFTPTRLIILGVLASFLLAVFAFFYFKYSSMIDARLRGDVFVRTTGIYAAPHSIHVGSGLALASLKNYLDGIGYVESSKDADSKRGRYSIKGNSIEIHTSNNAVINQVRQFPNVIVAFAASGKGITKISDVDTKRNFDSILLEPEMMTEVSNEKRQKQKVVSFKDLPKDYINATIAIEDRQFFEHSGINVRGIFRALWRDVGEGETREGGSSITQQLVKNFFLTPERTMKRKLQEMMIALVLETKLSKQEIFQLYANEVYMGQSGSYSITGVGEAASAYFNKDVVNLTLPESAFLAGLIRGPSLYSPYRDPDRAKARRNQVLDSMAEAGLIPPDKAEQAKATEFKIQPKRNAMNGGAPYFIDYLQQQLANDFASRDLERQSYRVYTTVDMDLQRAADKSVNDTLVELDKIFAKRKKNPIPAGTLQAALVALNPKTGEILAMVGGRDYGQSQLNRAVDAHRQPGSVFKPIVYATALNTAYEDTPDQAITPASLFMDAPETFTYGYGQTYSPENFGKVYSNRELTLREGLVHSLNVVTVRVAEKVGYQRVARMAERLGLPKPQPFPAMALGTAEATPLEVAQAYTAFANAGILATPHPTRRVTNSDGVGITETKPETRQVLRPTISWLMTNIMQDVLDHGTAARARSMGFTATAAGKTGTSRDGWFAGYTPNLLCVVWVGFDDNSELGLEGAKSALPIWTSFMKQALALRPDLGGEGFPKAVDGIVSADIDPSSGLLAIDSCPSHRTEYFIEGSQPTENCRAHSGETPSLPGLPGFTWPEDVQDKAKQAAKDAEKALDDVDREMRKQAKKAAGKQ